MAAQTVYAGPGKVVFNGVAYQADGENGQVSLVVDEPTTQRGTAFHGRLFETLNDQVAKLSFTPFDQWGILGALFPAFLGVTTSAGSVTNGAGAGVLAIGSRPHDKASGSANGLANAKVFAFEGRLYTMIRGAMTKHPSLKLGVGVSLYDAVEITGLGDPAKFPGDTDFLVSAPTESSASDPDSTGFATTDFVNGKWLGAWGALTGFTVVEPEDFWTLVPEVKYSTLTVEKLSRHMKLDSSAFMLKCRPVGPTHTQILAQVLAHTHGQILKRSSEIDMVLTGPSSKTITLKRVEIKGAGFEFGGTRLGTGEVGFVTNAAFTSGAPNPSLIFSA